MYRIKKLKLNICRKLIAFAIILLIVSMSVTAFAADDSRSYEFDLKVNGVHELHAEKGDVLTFTLNLKQTAGSTNEIYAFQTEILYDSTCLRLIENSNISPTGIEAHDVELSDGMHAYYINYVSMVGGEIWEQDILAGTFQMEVLSKRGELPVRNTNYSVSTKNGNDSFSVSAQDVKLQVGSIFGAWYIYLIIAILLIILLIVFWYYRRKKGQYKGKHTAAR